MEKGKLLTVGQIRRACVGNKYLLLTTAAGGVVGFNCRAISCGSNKERKNERVTEYIGYRPCNVDQYLSHKIVFYIPPTKREKETINH